MCVCVLLPVWIYYPPLQGNWVAVQGKKTWSRLLLPPATQKDTACWQIPALSWQNTSSSKICTLYIELTHCIQSDLTNIQELILDWWWFCHTTATPTVFICHLFSYCVFFIFSIKRRESVIIKFGIKRYFCNILTNEKMSHLDLSITKYLQPLHSSYQIVLQKQAQWWPGVKPHSEDAPENNRPSTFARISCKETIPSDLFHLWHTSHQVSCSFHIWLSLVCIQPPPVFYFLVVHCASSGECYPPTAHFSVSMPHVCLESFSRTLSQECIVILEVACVCLTEAQVS